MRYVLDGKIGLVIQTWVLVVAIAICVPFMTLIRVGLEEIRQRRRAAALGARAVPRVNGRWPGNVDILVKMLDDWRNGYPCKTRNKLEWNISSLGKWANKSAADGQIKWMDKLGSTFNMRFFWEDIIFTTEPEFIKVRSQSCFQLSSRCNVTRTDHSRHGFSELRQRGDLGFNLDTHPTY